MPLPAPVTTAILPLMYPPRSAARVERFPHGGNRAGRIESRCGEAQARGMKRRSLLLAAPALLLPGRVAAQPLPADPFPLGVASGWPRADGISLWTRLMGTGPAELGGGPRTVRWILAEDDRLTRPIAGGSVVADPAFAHSVHVDVRGLGAGRPYWYRFDVEGRTSPVGQTRTAAAA
ncbi:MAG: hypothetical protein FJX02_17410, partial [Alphaproteobacteria bacterium]|nr:hypothetical protein [Alphaproteobacteria bacterium]